MGVGFIQLVTTGNEFSIFNKEPKITFFRIYYRRHTNFFVNNYEINGNYIKKNNKLSFMIPKNGDFLGNTYLKIKYDEFYTEFFKKYDTLYNTQNTNILNFYDSYNIRTNEFSLDLVQSIKIIKVDFIFQGQIFLSIFCNNLKNEIECLDLLKSVNGIDLQTDKNNLFYNINEYYKFYGFNYFVQSNNFLNNEFASYLLSQIIYTDLQILRIDIFNYKLSINLKFGLNQVENFILITNFIFENSINNASLRIKIEKYTLYIGITYTNVNNIFKISLESLFDLIFQDTKEVELEIIDNKIKSNKFLSKDNTNGLVKNIFLNVNGDDIKYYNINNNIERTIFVIYSLKDTPFFGNFIPNDFNENIINNETNIITIANSSNIKLSINLYIRLYVALICKTKISIQEFLQITNYGYNFEDVVIRYSKYLAEFNKKILDILINNKILILSNETFRRIVYQNNIKNSYVIYNKITPFANRKITIFQNILINFYLYFDIIDKFSSKYNVTYDVTNILIGQLIYISKTGLLGTENGELTKKYFRNYYYNNNLFELADNPNTDVQSTNDVILLKDFNPLNFSIKNAALGNLMANYVIIFIIESIRIISNIFNKKSFEIFTEYGQLTNLFVNNDFSTSIFPLSSSIYISLGNVKDNCPLSENNQIVPNDITIFNTDKSNYLNNILKNVRINIQNDYKLYNTNFANTIDVGIESLVNNTILGVEFNKISDNYYESTIGDENQYNSNLIKYFIREAYNTNLIGIYSTELKVNLFDYFMYELFIYADNNIFNKSFQNFKFKKKYCTKTGPVYKETSFIDKSDTGLIPMYNSFIFNLNAPYYRIFNLFVYLAYLSQDQAITASLPSDLVNLRDIILKFMFEFIVFVNKISNSLTNAIKFQTQSINTDIVKNKDFLLVNNFLVYDAINIFNNDYFNYLISLNEANSFFFLYNAFYFVKNIFTIDISDSSVLFSGDNDSTSKTIYQYLYNFDDKIIILFLEVLEINKKLFKNYDDIVDLVNYFFNKVNFDYDNIFKTISKFYYNDKTESTLIVDLNSLVKNPFYYSCYYTIYSYGTIFDNTNATNVRTINNIFNVSTIYNNYYQGSSIYVKKNLDVKKNINFVNNLNITEGFNYISILFNELNFSYNAIAFEYYLALINSINQYIVQNISYLVNYSVSEFIFRECLNKQLLYVELFNKINNSKVNLIKTYYFSPITSFTTYNVIIIYLLYLSFLQKCLFADIFTFFQTKYSITQLDFNTFLIEKYSVNIYTQCINDFIEIFGKSNVLVQFDYSNILINRVYTSGDINIQDVYLKSYFLKIFTKENINSEETNFKIFYNQLNSNSSVEVYGSDSYVFSLNTSFYVEYNNIVNNFISQYNKILYSLLNGGIVDKTITSNFLSDVSLQKEYDGVRRIILNNSLYIIQFNIYSNLLKSSNSGSFQKYYSNEIQINILINNILFFYQITPTTNYFNTFYNIGCASIVEKENLLVVQESSYNSALYPIDNLVYFYSNYLNNNIVNSIYFEKDLNRIIYLLCTTQAIDLSENKNKSINYLKKNTLYKIVRVYNYNNSGLKIYKDNTSLYQDIDIFEILNYKNWSDDNSFMKNTWVNKILGILDSDDVSPKSYYQYYLRFKDFVIKNLPIIKDFKLSSGVAVIDYFAEIKNLDELHSLIFSLITSSDNFSPYYLYQNIINIKNDIDISSFLTVDIDYLKKKIIVFCYFNYLVYSFIHIFLVEYFTYDENLYLEYNIDGEIIDVKLKDVIEKVNNRLIINNYIAESYKINDDNPNNLSFEIPTTYTNKFEIEYLLNITKKAVDLETNLLILIEKFISSVNIQIGTTDINTVATITVNTFNSTISNLLQRLNVVFNYDISLNNLLKLKLTRSSINFLNIYIKNIIYDLNNIVDNTNFSSSNFVDNAKTYYKETNISDINLTLNLSCYLLKDFEITYPDLLDDINLVIGNIRLGNRYINDLLESFKGITTNFNISIDLILYAIKNSVEVKFNNDTLYTQFLSRANNIRYLSLIGSELDNLSICVPNDYDFANGNIDFGKFFPKFFSKYYSYLYNYYNFEINYTVIFPELNDYLSRLIENSIAINNIKNYNLDLYKKLYYTIIYTIYSIPFYSVNSIDETSYINMLNNQITLYKKFNFGFKINKKNIIQNLELQNFFNQEIKLTSYNEIYNYEVSLYYYIIFMTPINTDLQNSNSDLNIFFRTIRPYENYNMIYRSNIINYVLRLELAINLIIKTIEIKLGLKLIYDQLVFNKIIENIIDSISDTKKINDFINYYYANSSTSADTQKISIDILVNIIKYKDFLNRLSMAIKELIYYTNNLSVEKNIIDVWTKYFSGVPFDFLRIFFNDWTVRTYRMDIDDFTSFVISYLQFYINTFNSKEVPVLINNLAEFLLGVLRYKNKKNEVIQLDMNIVELIIFGQEISKPDDTLYEKSYNMVSIIIDILNRTYWNLINFNYINNTSNQYIDLQLTFYNFYLSYINFINSSKNISTFGNDYNYNNFISINNNLIILYRIIILTITSQYIVYEKYKNMAQYILTDCHNYVFNGKKINTLDMRQNIAAYFDYLNKNIIPNNIINNYYKDVQNNSIIDIVNYKIEEFKQPYNNFDYFTIFIYNRYINELNITNENEIGKLFINNTIINILNSYSGLIYREAMLENIQDGYIKAVAKYIIKNINLNLSIYKNSLGGDSYDIKNVYLSNKNIIQMFNKTAYKIGDKLVTIFSIIYSQINDTATNNDIIIILFYYNCFITWISTHCNNYINNIDQIIYDFSNLINQNILKYLQYINQMNYGSTINENTSQTNNMNKLNNLEEFKELNNFFDGLNLILFNTYSNFEYINVCYQFFNKILSIFNYPNKKLIKNSVDFNIKTFNGYDFKGEINSVITQSYNNQIYNDFIPNNKLIAWKYFLGLIVDFNDSDIIKSMKSSNSLGPLNPTNDFIEYIQLINKGVIYEHGILKIFNNINLLFDDEQIDNVKPETYKILLNLFTNLNKYPALASMLGVNLNGENEQYITNGLTNWIKVFNKKTFFIPMLFFFQQYKNAIPLIAGMYTNYSINVGLNSYNIFKNAYITNNLTEINAESALNMDFILVEREERKRICQKQIDNLVETHSQYNQNILINEIINDTYGDLVIVRFDFGINQVVKELIWTYTFFINQYKITNRHKEGQEINANYYDIYNSILNTRFYIDGARRDGVISLSAKNFNGITTTINPNRYHTRADADNYYNVYSFALEPEQFQPTGAMNLNPYKIFTIEIVLSKKGLVDYITNVDTLFGLNKLSMEIDLHTVNYNFVRYQSGLSGLLFI